MSEQLRTSSWYSIWILVAGTAFGLNAETLTRAAAVELALAHNPEVRAARAEWDAARARARIAWAPPDPEVGVEFKQLRRLAEPGDFGERSIGVQQRIESPVAWWQRRKAANHDAEATHEAVYEMARLDVSSRVGVAFDQVLLRRQQQLYASEHDSLLQEFASKSRLRFEAGDVPALEVLRAEVEAGRAANRSVSARTEVVLARAQLAALMAQGGSLGELESSRSEAPIEMSMSLDEVQRTGLVRRPDLRGARRRVESYRARQKASRADLFPDINVGVSRQTLRDAGAESSRWRLGVSLEVPLWGMARQRGQLAEAEAELVVSEAELEGLQRDVLLQIEAAYRRLLTAADQLRLYDEHILQEAEQARQVANDSYDQGKATYLDVIDAQRTLLQTRTEYAGILFTYRETWTALERAAGGGLTK
tara:strand:- start:4649 stop:5914 length:1266 start_codon:yes stop_codon:yes gene_type:complete